MPIETRSKTKSSTTLLKTPLAMGNSLEATVNSEKRGKKRKPIDENKIEIKGKPSISTIGSSVNSDLNLMNKENQKNSGDSTNLKDYEKQVCNLQKVLSAKYVDVIYRLKLNYSSNCVRDILFCKDHHSKNCPAPRVFQNESRMSHFLTENRPLNYLKVCNDMMQQGILPNESILNSIFQLIIAYRHGDEVSHYTSDYIVNESKMTLINFINLFPPCWKSIRYIYVNFCSNPIEQSKYLADNNNAIEHRNMFLFILHMIEKTIKENDEKSQLTSDKNCLMDNSIPESEAMFNFNEWETKIIINNNNNMNAYNREEKLNRLFLCLDVFVKIFEADLSIWILRYLSKPYKHIFTCDKPLIITSLLIKESNVITDHTRKMIELFIVLILNNYQNQQITIFKRLVSLLSVVMNLMDAEDVIRYPNIKTKTLNFAKEIFKSFEETAGLSFANFQKILENIEIPYIRLLIVDQFIKKLDNDTAIVYLTPKGIYEKISKLYWQKYKISPRSINIINGKIEPRHKIDIPNENISKYPKITDNIILKSSSVLEIYREEYLHLYLEALKIYCDSFFTKDFLLILMDCFIVKSSVTVSKVKKLNKKFNLEKLEKDAFKLLSKIDLDKSFEKKNSDDMPEYDGVGIDSDLILQYRNDFKYLSLLKKNLPVMIEKFGKEFGIFTEFIEFCFTPL